MVRSKHFSKVAISAKLTQKKHSAIENKRNVITIRYVIFYWSNYAICWLLAQLLLQVAR